MLLSLLKKSPILQSSAYKYCDEMLTRLKAVGTIGNCQRLVLIVGVSQHMHKITNL